MTVRFPHIIGISGATCSGKSSLARNIRDKLTDKDISIISSDWYYRDLSALPPSERERRNFDEPEALEMDLLRRHLEDLTAGRDIFRPVYDFSTHTRTAQAIQVTPGPVIIVEGIFVLYWEAIRQLLNTKVFVFLTDAESLARRLERDVRERGRTQQSVIDQYQATVKPMTHKFVVPTKRFADIVVSGTDPIEESAKLVISRIPTIQKNST
ncbi:MAG: uridine kinase [Pseudomonadota bacterium]